MMLMKAQGDVFTYRADQLCHAGELREFCNKFESLN